MSYIQVRRWSGELVGDAWWSRVTVEKKCKLTREQVVEVERLTRRSNGSGDVMSMHRDFFTIEEIRKMEDGHHIVPKDGFSYGAASVFR